MAFKCPDGWQLVPVVPTRPMIAVLRNVQFPGDWETGKKLQTEHGLDVVPPETNAEIAAGQYQRMLSVAPAPPEEK